MTSSRGSFQPRDQTQVTCIIGEFFTLWDTREAQTQEYSGGLFQMRYHLVPTFKYSLSHTHNTHTHTHIHIHVNHMYLPISTKILSPLGDITLILWKATKPLMLNCKFSKAIKEGRIGTKFQQVPQGNSKSGFQRFFLEIAFAVRVFINTLLRCRKSFTEKTWIYLQIHVLKGFHYSTWSSLYKKKNT